MRPLSGHEIDGLHCTECDHVFITTPITYNTDGFHRKEYSKGLTGLVIPAGGPELGNKDVVGEPE